MDENDGAADDKSKIVILKEEAMEEGTEGHESVKEPVVPPITLTIKRGPGRPKKDGYIVATGLPKLPSCESLDSSGSLQGPSASSSPKSLQEDEENGSVMSSPGYAGIDKVPADFTPSELLSMAVGRVCSLCACGERSPLGQGELNSFHATPGFNVFTKTITRTRRPSSDGEGSIGDTSPKHLTWRRSRMKMSRERSKSPRRPNPHCLEEDMTSMSGMMDELSSVGLTEDTQVHQLFDKTGSTYAHHCCAAWSEGVVQAEDFSLQFVDSAVFAGLSQECSHCHRYGATIKCRSTNCNRLYHYPCASASGCFQDIKTLLLLCPNHLDVAQEMANTEANCIGCEQASPITDQLFCTSCGQHYHSICLHPPVQVNPVVRAGWQCPDCKICQNCRQPGDDNKMLVCDTCDKGYHTFCLRPVMTSIPKNTWKCKKCRVCGDCGSRTPGNGPSSRWHHNYSVCDSCYQQRNKGLSCPICNRAYRHFTTQKSMAHCNQCKKYVHAECDDNINPERASYKDPTYLCPPCKNNDNTDAKNSSYSESTCSVPESPFLDETTLVEESTVLQGKEESLDDQTVLDDALLLNSEFSLLASTKNPPVVNISETNAHSAASALVTPHSIVNASSAVIGPGIGKPTSYGKKTGKASSCKKNAAGVGKKQPQRKAPDRKSRGKTKVKLSGLAQIGSQSQPSNDDEPKITTIICAMRDHFVTKQDICISCGSYGRSDEGRLITCTQCGQCYHPYCANVKCSRVMIEKGWRCLDCTVCEGCGKPHDEGRLILCDQCDISYHIYCLKPPLESVPDGSWKCKWCVSCGMCGANTPGFGSQWHANYSVCGPCFSLEFCPACTMAYVENDLVIECQHCKRWLHAGCDSIVTEQEAERAAGADYNCLFCRPVTGMPGPLPPSIEAIPSPPPANTGFDKPQRHYMLENVCVSEAGLNYIKNLTLKMPRDRKPNRKKKQFIDDVDELGRPNDLDLEKDLNTELPQEEGEISPGRAQFDPSASKKRQRRIIGLGLGGFIVRPRGRGAGSRNAKILPPMPGRKIIDDGTEVEMTEVETIEWIKKHRKRKSRPKRSELEDSFPAYLQEAFFGKSILEKSRTDETCSLEDEKAGDDPDTSSTFPFPASPPKNTSTENMDSLLDDLAFPSELIDMIEDFTEEDREGNRASGSDFHLLPTDMDNVDVDKIVNDFVPIDSKAVEDLFQGVLTGASSVPSAKSAAANAVRGQPMINSNAPTNMPPPQFTMSGERPNRQFVPLSRQSSEDAEPESVNKRNLAKWEKDDALGDCATVSPVLYCNLNHPELRTQYTEWNERAKQISKIWRKVPTERRAPYLAKARENRANSKLTRNKNSDGRNLPKDNTRPGARKADMKGAQAPLPANYMCMPTHIAQQQRVLAPPIKAEEENLEDLIAADGSFNLLEFADDDELSMSVDSSEADNGQDSQKTEGFEGSVELEKSSVKAEQKSVGSFLGVPDLQRSLSGEDELLRSSSAADEKKQNIGSVGDLHRPLSNVAQLPAGNTDLQKILPGAVEERPQAADLPRALQQPHPQGSMRGQMAVQAQQHLPVSQQQQMQIGAASQLMSDAVRGMSTMPPEMMQAFPRNPQGYHQMQYRGYHPRQQWPLQMAISQPGFQARPNISMYPQGGHSHMSRPPGAMPHQQMVQPDGTPLPPLQGGLPQLDGCFDESGLSSSSESQDGTDDNVWFSDSGNEDADDEVSALMQVDGAADQAANGNTQKRAQAEHHIHQE